MIFVKVSQPLGRVWDIWYLAGCAALVVVVWPEASDSSLWLSLLSPMITGTGSQAMVRWSANKEETLHCPGPGITSHYRHMPETHLSPLEITSLPGLCVVTGDGGCGVWAPALHTALKAPIRHRELKLDHRDHTGYWVWFEKMSNGLKWYLSDDAVWATLTGDVSNFTPT